MQKRRQEIYYNKTMKNQNSTGITGKKKEGLSCIWKINKAVKKHYEFG